MWNSREDVKGRSALLGSTAISNRRSVASHMVYLSILETSWIIANYSLHTSLFWLGNGMVWWVQWAHGFIISMNNSNVNTLMDAGVGGVVGHREGPGVCFSGFHLKRVSSRGLPGSSRIWALTCGWNYEGMCTGCAFSLQWENCLSLLKIVLSTQICTFNFQKQMARFAQTSQCLHKPFEFWTQRLNKRIRNDIVTLSSLCLSSFKVSISTKQNKSKKPKRSKFSSFSSLLEIRAWVLRLWAVTKDN